MDFVTTYELMNSWTFLVDHFQTSEYFGEQFSAGQNSANLWKITEIFTELVTTGSIHKMLNVAIDVYLNKVQIFWEGHKNLAHLPLFIWHYLVASNYKWKMGHIFVQPSQNIWTLKGKGEKSRLSLNGKPDILYSCEQ